MIPNSGGLSRKIGFKETIRHMFLDIESMLSVLATDTIPSIENSIKDKIHNKFEPNMKLLYYKYKIGVGMLLIRLFIKRAFAKVLTIIFALIGLLPFK